MKRVDKSLYILFIQYRPRDDSQGKSSFEILFSARAYEGINYERQKENSWEYQVICFGEPKNSVTSSANNEGPTLETSAF